MIKYEQEVAFWNERAQNYQKLDWAHRQDYLRAILNVTSFHKEDRVLDVGTGTGLISRLVAPHVSEVVGIDISERMLEKAKKDLLANTKYYCMDVRQIEFEHESFDKVTARMVFHGFVEDAEQGLKECHRVLKNGGEMIISEGSPPSPHVKPFYVKMFKLKEERRTFMPEDLVALMKVGGFENIRLKEHWIRQVSIRSWLNNSGLSADIQSKIFEMHLSLDEQGRRDYNMTLKDNDCFIDMRFIILVGRKNLPA